LKNRLALQALKGRNVLFWSYFALSGLKKRKPILWRSALHYAGNFALSRLKNQLTYYLQNTSNGNNDIHYLKILKISLPKAKTIRPSNMTMPILCDTSKNLSDGFRPVTIS
jgi:hypothetical protein